MTNWPFLICAFAAFLAAITDLRSRVIPNWLTYPLLVGALLGHGVLGGPPSLLGAFLGTLVCFFPSYYLFVRGGLGGGDVKLFAALGAMVGARDGLELQLTAFILICGFAVWRTAWNGRLVPLIAASYRATLHMVWPARFARPESIEGSEELPMGLAIFAATLALLARGAL